MFEWKWHDFDEINDDSDNDDSDPYSQFTQSEAEEFVTREFWVGSLSDGYLYIIGFQKIYEVGRIKMFLGDANHDGKPLTLPQNGAWIVSFDLAHGHNGYNHIELNPRQKRDLVMGVASALYDHYNVTKSALYFWLAARDELVSVYDSALGIGRDKPAKIKAIPMITKLNQLGETRRGYAIITQYYN
ncbi:hypothetical protein [Pantoea stewartii]|uniref:hypothetical protein n=1 Tax=Pantoea stewartii TaxID=66269 RepID=UPI0010712AAE|nr:hypothetical protein [Pantoea stewartii]